MTSENLVTIDFDSDTVNAGQNEEAGPKNNSYNCIRQNTKLLEETAEIVFSGDIDCNLDEILVNESNESQPLLGGCSTDHDTHQIVYNQFPSKFNN